MLDLFARALLAVVFLGAVAGKLRHAQGLAEFRDSVGTFAVRWPPPGVVAAAVVAGEASTVPLLMLPASRLGGYALAGLLLGTFSAGIALAVRRGRAVRCRCFGADGGVLGPRHLVRNGLLIAVGCLGALDGTEPAAQAGLVAVTVGALLGVVTIRWEDIAFLLGRALPAGRNR